LKKATTIDEILKINEKVAQTKAQIDRLKGRQTFLQRSSELATITVNLRPAADVLARTYSSQKTQLRRAESQRAQLTLSLQRARTQEEEATLRDQLGDVALQIDRFNARIAEIETEAATAKIALPAPPADDPSSTTATTSQDVVGDYLRLRGELRAERLSWSELAELQSLADQIDPSDVELLEAAGVPEFKFEPPEPYVPTDEERPLYEAIASELGDEE